MAARAGGRGEGLFVGWPALAPVLQDWADYGQDQAADVLRPGTRSGDFPDAELAAELLTTQADAWRKRYLTVTRGHSDSQVSLYKSLDRTRLCLFGLPVTAARSSRAAFVCGWSAPSTHSNSEKK